MIATVSGRIEECGSDYVVVEVGGVGLLVYVPAPLRDRLRAGENTFLYTQLIMRQDLLALYGFDTPEGREYFNMLLTVNGVGPRSALGILSALTPDAIRRAVFHEQADVFSRAPGIGKKTAQKILLQLQDKIKPDIGLEPVRGMSDVDSQVLEALTALGYSVVEGQAALQNIHAMHRKR